MGIGIYMRQVPYSGRVPEVGGRMAQQALLQARTGMAQSIDRIGAGLQNLGQQMQEDEEREAQLNELKAATVLDEYTRTALHNFPQMSWTDENGLSQHHTVTDAWRGGYDFNGEHIEGYEALKKSLADRLPKDRQALWLARIEAGPERKWRDAVESRGRELREDYATNTLSWALMGPGMAGDIQTAGRLRKQVQEMFPADEWPELSLTIDSEIAYGLARTDPELAKQYAAAYIPPTQREKVLTGIEGDVRAAQAEAQRQQTEKLRQGTVSAWTRWWKTQDGTAEPREILNRPSQVTQMVELGLMQPDDAHRLRAEMTGEARKVPDDIMWAAYDEVNQATIQLRKEAISEDEAFSVWLKNRHNLKPTDAKYFLGQMRKIPATQLDYLRQDAQEMATKLFAPLMTTAHTIDPQELLTMKVLQGKAMKQINDWSAQHFSADTPIDSKVFMEGAIRILERVKKEYDAKETKLRRERDYAKLSGQSLLTVAPPGYEQPWQKMTESQRQTFLALPEEAKKAFLEGYNRAMGPTR